jgi:radical SAM superfamily enzyme YgiQ (UPF0313 family)
VRVCLVSAPALSFVGEIPSERDTDRQLAEDAALGVLTLLPILENAGFACTLTHGSELVYRAMRNAPGDDAVLLAAREIAAISVEVVGFATICSSYPATLRMATEVKRLRPDCIVVLGGPQSTVTDVATLKAFPAIDIVVRGEADETFPQLLTAMESNRIFGGIGGLTYRKGHEIIRTPNASPVLDIDRLPIPAFDRLRGVHLAERLPLELGRGCPFACTFCSTNDFFRRRFRLKSPAVLLSQVTHLQDRYPNIQAFDLTHDMFTVDRRRVVEFCRAVLESGLKFRWSSSARTDCIDEELIDLMAEAGCVSIFFGIETGSQRMQKIIDKGLDLDEARRMIRYATGRSVRTSIGTIIGFPEETEDDLSATLDFVFDAAAQRLPQPQISVLSPLARTPIYDRYQESLHFDGEYSDFCQQVFPQYPDDIELIRQNKAVFQSFYSVPTRLPAAFLREAALFFSWLLIRCRWLGVALTKAAGGPLSCFRQWLAYRGGPERGFHYYSSHAFHKDIAVFAGKFVDASAELKILAAVHVRVAELATASPVEPDAEATIAPHSVPVLAVSAAAFDAPGDPEKAIEALNCGKPVLADLQDRVTLIARRKGYETEVFQPSDALLHMLRLCDGQRSAMSIAQTLTTRLGAPISGCDAAAGWLASLEYLRQDGLLEVRPAYPEACKCVATHEHPSKTVAPSIGGSERSQCLPV